MNFSAAASSSAVVTPARAFEASMRRQRTRISPATAIFATCSGVLVTIIQRYTLGAPLDRLVGFQLQRRQGPLDLVGDLIRGGGAVDPAPQAVVGVNLDHRRLLRGIRVEPVADHVRLVVVADDQLAAV